MLDVARILLWPPVIAIKFASWPLVALWVLWHWYRETPLSDWPDYIAPDFGRGRPFTLNEMIFRNFGEGFKRLFDHPPFGSVSTIGLAEPGPTYHDRRFAWRYRSAGLFASFRAVWVYWREPLTLYKPDSFFFWRSESWSIVEIPPKYGELYIGWKLLSEPPDLDFATSLRVFSTVGE